MEKNSGRWIENENICASIKSLLALAFLPSDEVGDELVADYSLQLIPIANYFDQLIPILKTLKLDEETEDDKEGNHYSISPCGT